MPGEPLATTLGTAVGRRSRSSRARLVFSVFKPRIAFEITLTAVAGAAITPGPALSLLEVLVLALAVFLSAGAAGAYNQVSEPASDRIMLRTRRRAFATGELTPGPLWYAAIVGLTAFSVLLAAVVLNGMVAAQVLLGSLTYGYIYTAWLKRRTWMNIVIGGLAGSFAALAGSAAVDPQLPLAAWVFAAALFFWTPPHFWSLAFYGKADYARADIPMLPNLIGDRALAIVVLVHTVILVALTLLPPLLETGWIYGLCAAGGGAYFIWTSIVFVRRPTRSNAMANFHGSLWQLGLLLLGAITSAVLSGHLAV